MMTSKAPVLVLLFVLAVMPRSVVAQFRAVRQPISRTPAVFTPARVPSLNQRLGLAEATGARRGGHALVGGVIGGVAGIVTCTLISNAIKDRGTGFSTCTVKGYLALGGGGALLGALIGSQIK